MSSFHLYCADCIGNRKNCLYPHAVEVSDSESLASAVCMDYVAVEYRDGYRSGERFIRTDCLALDCDNDHSDSPMQWVTPEIIMELFQDACIVDDAGLVTAIGKGTAKITAAATDGSKVKASITVKVEKYDLVFASKRPQKVQYRYSGSGKLSIRGSVKNGNVSIPDIDTDMYTSVMGGPAIKEVEVAPLHPGTDVVTIKINGKKLNYKVYVADYFENYDVQYFELTDTSPKKANGSFRDVVYGTAYSDIKTQLEESYGPDFTIKDYGYGFSIIFNNPGITVAGHDVESVSFGFCYSLGQDGYISKDESATSFYSAEYIFSSEPNNSVAENLHLKMNELYGKSDQEEYRPKHIRNKLDLSRLSWSDNGIYITLYNSTNLSVSYLWDNGFSRRQELSELIGYLKEVEEQRQKDAEQEQFGNSTDGL